MAKQFKQTPAGIAEWPHFHAPDTKFDKDGVYRTKVRYRSVSVVQDILDDAKRMIAEEMAKEKERRAEAKKKDPKKTFKPLKEADSPITINDETGEVTISFKMKASGTKKDSDERWTRKLAIFGADGTPLPAGVRVGGGSEIKVAYDMAPFATAIGVGVSLRLEAVQVINLVEFGGGDAKYFGFSNEVPEEDGTNDSSDEPAVEGAGESTSDDF